MKKNCCLFFGIILLLFACSTGQESVPEYVQELNQVGNKPLDGNQEIEIKLLELQSDNTKLQKENEKLKTDVQALTNSIEIKDEENEIRLQAMEDLISLMEQSVRGTEEKNSQENFTAITPINTLKQNDAMNMETSSQESADNSLILEPVSPQSIDFGDVSDEENLGLEPFDNPSSSVSNFSDPNLVVPLNYPKLTRNPRAKDYYNNAYSAYTAKDYPATIELFKELISLFPSDQYTDNAFFWIGMSYYYLESFDKAEEYYRKVIQDFKHGPTSMGFKTPDSIYMLGVIREKEQKWEEARYYYDYVIQAFPDSGSADNARSKIKYLVFKSS